MLTARPHPAPVAAAGSASQRPAPAAAPRVAPRVAPPVSASPAAQHPAPPHPKEPQRAQEPERPQPPSEAQARAAAPGPLQKQEPVRQPETPPKQPAAQRGGWARAKRFAAIGLVAALAWMAWFVMAFYDFSSALENGDAVALERRVDWGRVQQGLRDDLNAIAAAQPVAALNERSIAALTGRQAIANLLRTVRLDDRGWDIAPPATWPAPAFRWLSIREAFFSGGPFAFRVDIRPQGETVKDPLTLLFKWRGDWELVRAFLPDDAFGRTPPAPRTAETPRAAAASSVTPPAGAQQAVLYEETPSEPNGRRSTGTVTWRTEGSPGVAGESSDIAVVADARIPEQKFGVTMTIRRNHDRALPASHTIDLRFDLPPDQPNGGILNIVAVRMAPDDRSTGQQLASSIVQVSPDYFLVGLSAAETDTRLNLQILKERPWVGIQFIYANNRRGLISFEKGTSGEKVVAEALGQWTTAP